MTSSTSSFIPIAWRSDMSSSARNQTNREKGDSVRLNRRKPITKSDNNNNNGYCWNYPVCNQSTVYYHSSVCCPDCSKLTRRRRSQGKSVAHRRRVGQCEKRCCRNIVHRGHSSDRHLHQQEQHTLHRNHRKQTTTAHCNEISDNIVSFTFAWTTVTHRP